MARGNGRSFLIFSGLIVIVGSILSMVGGSQHPMIGPQMGTYGSDKFFLEFAKLMTDPMWEPSHWRILWAPVLWCLGSLSLVYLARSAGERRWTVLGYISLIMGTALYVVTYIGDGFVSPQIGKALIAASEGSDPTLTAAITQTFASVQWFTIKVGLPSWMLLAFGMIALSIGLFALARTYRGFNWLQTVIIAGAGVVIGAWSFVAYAAGSYEPGPMVSEMWLPAAIATNVWFLQLGITILVHGLFIHGRQQPAEGAHAA